MPENNRRPEIVPYKPKRPCSYPGCPLLTDGRYCEQHSKQEEARYNKYERDPEAKKRYGRAWKRIRDRYISANPLCAECATSGRITPAEEVHHIVPLGKGGTHDTANLMSLCRPCHSTITARHGGRWRRKS
jgi:5-methylcytosine-specific restriction protein A